MAFGLDYDMNAFYSGHYWNATCLDVTKIDLYAQDSRSGERLLLFLSNFFAGLPTKFRRPTQQLKKDLYRTVMVNK